MRILSLLYILHLCRICVCADDGLNPGGTEHNGLLTTPTTGNGHIAIESDSSEKPITLDISNVDLGKVVLSKKEERGIESKEFTPHNGFHFDKVVDGDNVLWTAGAKEECRHVHGHSLEELALLVLSVKSDGMDESRYYIKQDDGVWTHVDKKEFDERLEELEKKLLEPTRVTLDIANPDETNTVVTVESTDGITCVVCVSKTVVRLESVVDGQEEVWTAKEGERCMLANVLSDDKSTFLAMWVDKANNNDFRYYVKNADGSWHAITKEEYNEKSESIRNSLKDFRERKFGVLDLSSPNSSNIDISEESRAGVKWKECKPKEGVKITSVVYKGSEVWKAKEGEKCLLAGLLSDSKSTFIGIGIDSAVIPEYKYYAKNASGEWTEINKDVYEGKSKTLKEALQSSREVRGAVTDSLEAFKNLPTGNSPSDSDSTQLPSVPDTTAPATGQPTHLVKPARPGNLHGTNKEEPDETSGQSVRHTPEPPRHPPNLTSKVDSSLFTAQSGKEDGVTVLKLTAKAGVQPKKLAYNRKDVWSNGTTSLSASFCSSATIYLDGDFPKLAVVKTKDSRNEESTLYKYYFGEKWQNDNANSHNIRLAELKKTYENANSS